VRSVAVVALLCSSAAAEPAKTAVDKLVRTAIATVGASLFADHVVIDIYGMDESEDLVAVGALRTHGAGGKITRKLDPHGVAVVADEAAGAAWFVAPYAVDIVDTPMDVQEVHTRERVAGLALRIGDTWRLAGLLYARTMPDKELMDPANLSTAADAIPTVAEIVGDAAVGREVRGWFATGLAKAAAPDVVLLASGTQSSELATTTAASLKLAAAWDALKLVPDRIHASLFGDGKLAFVTAAIYLPRKTGPGAVRMSVAIVATRTTTGWRWVSLQFSA
jgi:hypothetical protein